jgi:acyl-CoA synthetase (AMP-forming)/AMP-acid ligase II
MTLLNILEKRAAESPRKIAFTFHHDPPCTYGDLWQQITCCGGYLLQQGLKPGEPVIIVIPNSGQFFYAFYGVQWAGGIAVPVFPGSGSERILKLADLCGATLIITSDTYPPDNLDELKQKAKTNNRRLFPVEKTIKSFCGGIESVGQWVSESVGQKVRRVERAEDRRQKTEDGNEKTVSQWVNEKKGLKASKPFLHENSNTLYDHQHFDAFSAESVQLKKPSGGPKGLIGPPCHGALVAEGNTAFIQFTSGSVGDPKGVQLTHANLITNVEQMIAGMEITQPDIFVSWLPVYHDMGLILMTMVPFYLGLPLTLLPTGYNYLKTWLKTIQDQGATFTAAPDFAYRLCLLYIKDPENYDLSSLRVALNAAEMVRSGTIQRFEERFKLEHVMLPAYGLAEATVGVCSWQPGEKVKVDTRGFVSVGSPFPGVQMRIARDNKPAKPGEIGEILVKSEANTGGYFQNPKATKDLFTQEGYIKTGDLGYVDKDGDYFIVGRKKNIIIQGGFNIAAGEIEELVDEFPFVRRSAAVGIDRGSTEGEQVYIFIEVNLKKSQLQKQEIFEDITLEVVQQFDRMFGFKPGRVYLLKTRAVPMTYNGKIKYLQLKEDYVNGTLRKEGLILFPEY